MLQKNYFQKQIWMKWKKRNKRKVIKRKRYISPENIQWIIDELIIV